MYTIDEQGHMVNEAGEIALRWNMLTQKLVQVHGREYLFRINRDISLAWVQPEDVEDVLRIRIACCGGTGRAQSCHYASELDVKRWLEISVW